MPRRSRLRVGPVTSLNLKYVHGRQIFQPHSFEFKLRNDDKTAKFINIENLNR